MAMIAIDIQSKRPTREKLAPQTEPRNRRHLDGGFWRDDLRPDHGLWPDPVHGL